MGSIMMFTMNTENLRLLLKFCCQMHSWVFCVVQSRCKTFPLLSEVKQHTLLEGKLGFCWLWYVQLYFGIAECIGVASNSQTCMSLEVLTSCKTTEWPCPPMSWSGKLSTSSALQAGQADVLCALMLFWDKINFSTLVLIHYMSLSSTNGPPRPISQTN